MDRNYYPEGTLLFDEANVEYTSSLSGLESAMEKEIILEASVVLCDSEHNLHVNLGKYKGIIPRREVLYSPAGEDIKDIAIITRVGKSVCFYVTDIIKDGKDTKITLSRRRVQMDCCENYISRLKSGDIIRANVTHMEKFGAFCDIGCGLVGLLPVDCISVSRINHPSERFCCGQSIKCAVKTIDSDICRVTLTHKELLGTWMENVQDFNAGETACGIIRSVEPYGIFVELTPNLAGLAEWCEGAYAGQTAAVYIKSIIPEKMKIKLVIVDVTETYTKHRELPYKFDGNHMDVWRYSPKECTKEIYTLF